jgi:hypothetical protein
VKAKLSRPVFWWLILLLLALLGLRRLALAQTPDTPIPATLFGLHYRVAFPAVPFGALRCWDCGARWQQIEFRQGQYNFAALDKLLQQAAQHHVEVLVTLSATPPWASQVPGDKACDYSSTAAGSCAPPLLLDMAGVGSNTYWRNYLYAMGDHIRNLPAGYARPTAFELWNEFTRRPTAWHGTNAQMLTLLQDAICILAGRGEQLCSTGAMNVPAVGLVPGVEILTPNSVMTAPEINNFHDWLNIVPSASITTLAVHGYVQNGSCCAQPETIQKRWQNLENQTPALHKGKRVWSTEGSWGIGSTNLPDVDMQQGFVPRYYLVGWSSGFERLYWYAYDNLQWGTLYANGALTKAGKAYATTYGWMVGNRMTQLCAPVVLQHHDSSPIWSCGLTKPDGTLLLAVWDTSQTCSKGVCTTSTYTVPTSPRYTGYYTLNDNRRHVLGKTVGIGLKPVLLATAAGGGTK